MMKAPTIKMTIRKIDLNSELVFQWCSCLSFVLLLPVRKGLLRDRTDCWSILENMVKFAPDASDMVTSVKEMTHVKYVCTE